MHAQLRDLRYAPDISRLQIGDSSFIIFVGIFIVLSLFPYLFIFSRLSWSLILFACIFVLTESWNNCVYFIYSHVMRLSVRMWGYIWPAYVGSMLQSLSFMVLMITKHMWLFVLIKFKSLSIFQGFKNSRSFFSKGRCWKLKKIKYEIKTRKHLTSLMKKPGWSSCSHLEPYKILVC